MSACRRLKRGPLAQLRHEVTSYGAVTEPDAVTSPDEAAAADQRDRLASMENKVEGLYTVTLSQEHRTIPLIRNALQAVRPASGWSAERRVASLTAALYRLFFAKPVLVVTLSVGSLLALHANLLLLEQNDKLDLQNHLVLVSSHISEAQRNAQFAQLLPPLYADIQRYLTDPKARRVETRGYGNVIRYELPRELTTRVATLSQALQPYRWIAQDIAGDQFTRVSRDGRFRIPYFFRDMARSGFGRSEAGARIEKDPVPTLTAGRWSPERGQLLVNMHAFGVSSRSLLASDTTFAGAYLPNARVLQLDVGTMLVGPMASNVADLRGANFSNANLSFSNFQSARLEGADFSGAILLRVEMQGSKLADASFRDAELSGVNFAGCVFDRTDVTNATLNLANLVEADLTGIKPGSVTAEQIAAACFYDSTKLPVIPGFNRATAPPPKCAEEWNGGMRRR
jgi:hypothetical protein